MGESFLPFTKPCLNQAAIDEVVECLKSGWLTTGPRVQHFEEALKNYFNAPYVLALNSATAGLHIALASLDLQPDDEVITTPLTFIATLNTIVLAGATPVLIDIDPKTLNMDLNQLESKINAKTRALLPVHFAGLPVNLEVIYALAEKHNIRVIEDAAHSIGASFKGKKIGSFGDTQIFSFHPNKNMTTGEGGCLVTRDQKLAKTASILRFHGIDREVFNRFSAKGNHHYDVVAPGYKYNMLDLQAALGIHQLQQVDLFNNQRAQLVRQYREALSEWPQITLPSEPHADYGHVWHLFTILIHPETAGVSRDDFIQQMKSYQIGTGFHYQSAHLYTFYREQFGFKPGDFPEAEKISERIVSLPLFPHMTLQEQERVIQAMKHIFKIR